MGKLKMAKASEMVERVAAAILDAEGVCWEDTKDWEKNQYRNMARAAIEAMREPTGEMKDAGAETFDYNADHSVSLQGHPTKCWQAMIDAALAKAEG